MSKQRGQRRTKFDLSGGVLCLDFANTVSKRLVEGESHDNLATYDDLLAFATQTLYFPVEFAKKLTEASQSEPRAAARALEIAHRLREAIYRTFLAVTAGRPAAADDLLLIQNMTIEGWKHRWLTKVGQRYIWLPKRDEATQFDGLLWPIAESASNLLTSDRLKKVRECDAPTCAWLFLDESRNQSRRWCDMKICGNREKARRHYQREHM
jgi:predicted RNA-binding Zn ribbon-like protein